MNLITCQNVSFAYNGTVAVKDLNFTVTTGDYLCIAGENGAGKSTLVKGLLNLIRPSGGTIRMADSFIASEIGYLPQQNPIQKDFPASVHEVVLSGCLNRLGWLPFYRADEKRLAQKNMERLGIAHLRNRCYAELSGGQQQRVLLARALCAAKKAILLDEPAAGLDPVVSQELYELIQSINQDGMTVIMVTHDIAATLKYARHILHLQHTQLFFGTTGDYIHSDIGRIFTGGNIYGRLSA